MNARPITPHAVGALLCTEGGVHARRPIGEWIGRRCPLLPIGGSRLASLKSDKRPRPPLLSRRLFRLKGWSKKERSLFALRSIPSVVMNDDRVMMMVVMMGAPHNHDMMMVMMVSMTDLHRNLRHFGT